MSELDVVLKCAQSLHVIRVLRRHGMNDQCLQAALSSPNYSKRPVPGGASRPQMIDIVSKLASLYPADGPAAAQLVENYDDTLF